MLCVVHDHIVRTQFYDTYAIHVQLFSSLPQFLLSSSLLLSLSPLHSINPPLPFPFPPTFHSHPPLLCSLLLYHPFLLSIYPIGLVSGNDTVIGDPLFAIPFRQDLTSLCYEVHGRTNTFINLISDTCTNVNALYTAMQTQDNGNIISQVGVRAVGDSGQCYNVRVDLTGCALSVDGIPMNTTFDEDGIRVRRTLNRVRISVPNCENKNLVMVVTCSFLPEPMIRFDIMRGLNLRPTSHGLLGK